MVNAGEVSEAAMDRAKTALSGSRVSMVKKLDCEEVRSVSGRETESGSRVSGEETGEFARWNGEWLRDGEWIVGIDSEARRPSHLLVLIAREVSSKSS